jgi:hypothetical protein
VEMPGSKLVIRLGDGDVRHWQVDGGARIGTHDVKRSQDIAHWGMSRTLGEMSHFRAKTSYEQDFCEDEMISRGRRSCSFPAGSGSCALLAYWPAQILTCMRMCATLSVTCTLDKKQYIKVHGETCEANIQDAYIFTAVRSFAQAHTLTHTHARARAQRERNEDHSITTLSQKLFLIFICCPTFSRGSYEITPGAGQVNKGVYTTL